MTGPVRPAALALLLAGPLAAQDGGAIMDRAASTYRSLASFSADFRQVIDDSMLGSFRSRGTLVQAGESRLAMRFTEPSGEAIVLDGTYAWVYLPTTQPGEVLRFDLRRFPSGLNLLGLILDRPRERYRISYLRTEPVGGREADVLQLVPTDPAVPFRQATVWLDREDNLPRQIAVLEPMRSGTRTVSLYNVRTNIRLTDATFRFAVPAGVRVIDQM